MQQILNSETAKQRNSLFKSFKFVGIFMLLFTFLACEKDYLPQETTEIKTYNAVGNFGQIDLKNGRLVFDNQAQFDQVIEALKGLNEEELRTVFVPYYDQGFIPLYPYYKENETKRIKTFLQKKKALRPQELKDKVLEFADPLISDDLFASLLNYKREIVLNGEILKYTFSGLLIANVKDSLSLKRYVSNNNINDFIPDPSTLPEGMVQLTADIDSYVAPRLPFYSPCLSYGPGNEEFGNPLNTLIPCISGGYGGPFGDGPTPPNYTSSLINYVDDLMPCNYDDAGIFGLTPFGTRKVCFEEFSGGYRRTKTLYSNEDFWVYTAIQVKVKHQRYHHIDDPIFGTTIVDWWASQETDEVALIIDEAVFRITPANMTAPPPPGIDLSIADINEGNMIFYSGGLVVDPSATTPQIVSWPVPASQYPSTPFDEEVIVHFFNENLAFTQDMTTTVDEVTDLFWNTVYDLAVAAGNKVDTGGETTKITMLLSSPTSTIVHHVDLSSRQTNTKKIVEILDDDWGAVIKFTIPLGSNGKVITNPAIVGGGQPGLDISVGVELGDLTDFDDIYMNFTGVTRNGSEWKGSKMVYKAIDNN